MTNEIDETETAKHLGHSGVTFQVPRIIAISPQLAGKGPKFNRDMRSVVANAMSPGDGSVTSRSGMTAALAIEWCEVRGEPYTVTAHPGYGYHVRRGA